MSQAENMTALQPLLQPQGDGKKPQNHKISSKISKFVYNMYYLVRSNGFLNPKIQRFQASDCPLGAFEVGKFVTLHKIGPILQNFVFGFQ